MLYTVHVTFIIIFYGLSPIALNNLTKKLYISIIII